MCGGGGGGGGVSEQLAVQSANQEQARQDRINQGMRELEIMFNGGRRVTNQLGKGTQYDPNATYYNKDGSVWQPGDLGAYRTSKGLNADNIAYTMPYQENIGGGEGGSYVTRPGNRPEDYAGAEFRQASSTGNGDNMQYSPQGYYRDGQYIGAGPAMGVGGAAADAKLRQMMFEDAMGGGIYGGAEEVAGYGDSFYDKAYQAQLDYAMPQVDRQYADAQKSLEFALARQGLSASSQAGQLQADLARQRDLAIQSEQDKANTVRQQQRSAVEDERSNLTQMLQQTGDVQSTMNAAAARKNIIDSAPAIQEVGPLFQNATGALADMIVSPSMRAASGNRTGSAGYGASKGSGKVVT